MTPTVELGDKWGYFLFIHDCKDEQAEQRYLSVGNEGWSYDPLTNTVSPSIHCMGCGTHGHWTNGEWRPC